MQKSSNACDATRWEAGLSSNDEDPASESPTNPPLQPGHGVGEYQVESKIGAGAFGVVYSAFHPVIGKRAALKVLHRTFSAAPRFVHRFIEDARAANKIRHHGIVDIFGIDTLTDGRQYCIIEMPEGMTLDAYIQNHGR